MTTTKKPTVGRYLLIALALVTGAFVAMTVPPATANADSYCGINSALDPATNRCKPIYSTPTGGCDPNILQSCLGGNWMDIPISTSERYSVICQQLFLNDVSVQSVEDIYHMLYEPPYGLSGREAGRSVALAVQNECPEFKSAMLGAMRQALS